MEPTEAPELRRRKMSVEEIVLPPARGSPTEEIVN